MGLIKRLYHLGEARWVYIVHRVIFTLSLLYTPFEEPINTPIADVYGSRLVALLVE
jgi:hypothetical protein